MPNLQQDKKYHLIPAFDFFTKPNEIISSKLELQVDIFKEGIVICTHSHGSHESHEEKIKNILKYGTPRYYCKLYPKNHSSYIKEYPVGAFYAHESLINHAFFFKQNLLHGPLLLIYDKSLLQKTDPPNPIYTINEGHIFHEALLGVFDPDFGKNMRERLQIQVSIREYLAKNNL